MSYNLLTIITTIAEGKAQDLRVLLRSIADPEHNGRTFLRCKPEFLFDNISGLHFCSFVILDAEDGFAPCLIFEATFDGAKTDFIHALLKCAPYGMDRVYRHCEGYPASGILLPNIVGEYLLEHDVGAHTFFSGCPDRPVGQIASENRLRSDMIAQLAQMQQRPGAEPTTLAGVRERLQAEVVCHEPRNEWAEQECPYATDTCAAVEPPLRPLAGGRLVACHYVDEEAGSLVYPGATVVQQRGVDP